MQRDEAFPAIVQVNMSSARVERKGRACSRAIRRVYKKAQLVLKSGDGKRKDS